MIERVPEVTAHLKLGFILLPVTRLWYILHHLKPRLQLCKSLLAFLPVSSVTRCATFTYVHRRMYRFVHVCKTNGQYSSPEGFCPYHSREHSKVLYEALAPIPYYRTEKLTRLGSSLVSRVHSPLSYIHQALLVAWLDSC